MFFLSQHLLSYPCYETAQPLSSVSLRLECQNISRVHHCLSTTFGSHQASALRPLTPETNLYPAARVVPLKAKSDHCSTKNPPAVSCLNQGKTQ